MAERGGALVMPQIRRGTTPVIILLISLLLSCQSKEKVKFHQYYVQGEQLYLKHCSNCHKADGEGLRLLYPPVSRSDFMDNNFAEVICLMKYGRSGEMEVNGKNFNQPMPGVPTLTELELAEIATFIYNTWEHDRGLVEINEISSSLSKCAPE
jgi:cytochrome c